jgi:predicted nucleotidyltransferase
MSNIQNNETFKKCGGVILCELIAGSRLYGLNTPDSDTDYRGIFCHTHPHYLSGFEKVESIVQTKEIDSCHYEVMRYLQLLRKSNTQVLEIVFAPNESFTVMTDDFALIREHRYRFIDTNQLKNSLKGYVYSELRLATGERSGQLGGKRKQAVEAYGHSPKNFCQIMRLCEVGKKFFQTGEYMVKVKDFDTNLHDRLMDIKTNPQDYSCEDLKVIVEKMFQDLCDTMDNSKIEFQFDLDLASDIINNIRQKYGYKITKID